MIVLDASAAVELVLGTAAGQKISRWVQSPVSLHAPHLIDLEVVSALRRLESAGKLSASDATEGMTLFRALDVTRWGHAVLLPRVWQLRGRVTPYDAAYLALAESLPATLLTCDAPLARAPGHSATVELIEA